MFEQNAYSLKGKRIWVTGHRGLVGSAMMRRLAQENCTILTSDIDLRDQEKTHEWLEKYKPEVVVVAAAKVGGIGANSTYPADFLYDNLMISANIIHAAHEGGVEKLLFLGSSCIYPKNDPQPIEEKSLLSGTLEPTNEGYALAKIAGVKLCAFYRAQYGRDFIAAMPCNLYGPGDRFDIECSHVIPALMMKAHAAKISGADYMTVWGTGTPLREFLYVDDLADALVFLLERYSGESSVNVGSGTEISIADLGRVVTDVVGFEGTLKFDLSKPDGTPRKVLNSSKIMTAGWRPQVDLRQGLEKTYTWYTQSL